MTKLTARLAASDYDRARTLFNDSARIRGILHDEYGFRSSEMHWFSGGLEQPRPELNVAPDQPKDIDLQVFPAGATLSRSLGNGKLDPAIAALASPRFNDLARTVHVRSDKEI